MTHWWGWEAFISSIPPRISIYLSFLFCQLKKKTQPESCNFSIIWGSYWGLRASLVAQWWGIHLTMQETLSLTPGLRRFPGEGKPAGLLSVGSQKSQTWLRHYTTTAEDLGLGCSLSALRNCSGELRRKPGYRVFCWGKNVVNHQKITDNYKEEVSQVNDFGTLLCMRCKNQGSLKLSLRYLS